MRTTRPATGPRRRAPALIAAMFSAMTAGHHASAQPVEGDAAARADLLDGARRVQAEDYGAAITALERAARGGAGPLAQYNLGLAYRAVGRYRDAVDAWDRYLAAPEPGAPEDRIAATRAERDALLARCSRVRVRFSPDNAVVTVDGAAPPRSRGAEVRAAGVVEWLTDPGEHRIEVRAEGHAPWSQTFVAGAVGSNRTFDVRLSTAPAAGAVTVAGRPIPWWSWLGMGVAAAGFGTAIGFAVDGANIRERCRLDPLGCAANERAIQASLEARTAGTVVSASVGAAGLGLLVTGIVWGPSSPPSLAPTNP
jgi:hypothetical protein